MVLTFFKKVIFSIFSRKKSITKDYGKNVEVSFSYSYSDALEKSRKMREDAVYSGVLLPDGVDEKFRDPEILFAPNLDTPLEFKYYDYLRAFEENHSLGQRAFPLCVSPNQVEFIKKTRALYCHEQKCWFWPYNEELHIIEMKSVLPRIHNPLCDHPNCKSGVCTIPPLLPNLVPEPLWGENLRKYLKKEEWDFLRKHTYASSGYRCSICGGIGEKWPVECNEVWDYRSLEDGRNIAVLIELKALCARCHQVNHLGKANIDGKYNEAIRHMAYINGWSLNYAGHVADDAFKTFSERSEKTWLLGYDDECDWSPSIEKILKTFFCETEAP